MHKDVVAGRCCLGTIENAHDTLNLHKHAAGRKFDVFTRTAIFLEVLKDEEVASAAAARADPSVADAFFSEAMNVKAKSVKDVKTHLQQKKNDNPTSKHFVNVVLIREIFKDVPAIIQNRRCDELEKGLDDVRSFVGMPSP